MDQTLTITNFFDMVSTALMASSVYRLVIAGVSTCTPQAENPKKGLLSSTSSIYAHVVGLLTTILIWSPLTLLTVLPRPSTC